MEAILLQGGVSLRWCLQGAVYATPTDVTSKQERYKVTFVSLKGCGSDKRSFEFVVSLANDRAV
eukprot:9300617-Ditylum_brightwellii.AAC.1